MRRALALITWLVCFSTGLSAQNSIESDGALMRYIKRVFESQEDSTEPKLINYPTLAFAPETNWEFGVSSLYVYSAHRDLVNRLSEIKSFAFYTVEGQYGLWLDHALYSDKDKWFFLGKSRYQNFPLLYHGIGRGSPAEVQSLIEGKYFIFRERIMRETWQSLYFGLELDFQNLSGVGYTRPAQDFTPPELGGGGGGNNAAADLVDYGTDAAMYADRYELKTNEDVNDWSDLISFIDFINNTELDAFAEGIDFRMDVDGFLRSAALDMLFSNLDSYTGSARNYYIYHNQDTNHWEWIKWDGNEAFGSYTNGAGNMETVAIDYTNPTRPLLERMFDHDDLYSRYLDHVCELTETLFNETHLHERIDVLTELIASSVYADDNKMYSNADFDVNLVSNLSGGGGPMGGTTYGLKSFVTNRSVYVASQLECQTVSDVETHASSLHAFPNPVQHEVMVDGLPKNSDVSLLNASGRVVFQTLTRDQSMLRIDVSALAEGVYIVRSSHGWAERLLIVR